MRLLLVEDDPMIGEAVLDLLRAEHYAVDWVRDGEMADTALQARAYDLVVLDLGLPRRDGLDVLRALRARLDRTPVLIATARDAKPDRIAGLHAEGAKRRGQARRADTDLRAGTAFIAQDDMRLAGGRCDIV